MIKLTLTLSVGCLLLSCAGLASAAAPASCAALSQLAAAAPGGADALAGMLAAIPEPAAAPRSEPGFGTTYDTARADVRINAFAEAARKRGELGVSRLFARLAEEGTPKEKFEFMNHDKTPYAFPARFRMIRTAGVCREIAKLFCTLSCINTGTAQQQCWNDCQTIIVNSCD